MKGFQKLILASAIIAATSSAFAMEAMDEDSMSATTGQDGLTVTLNTTITNLNVTYIDRDGVLLTGHDKAGAVVIGSAANGIDVSAALKIDIDAGGSVGDTTGDGMLQIKVENTAPIVIGLGLVDISVADANDGTGLTLAARSAVGAKTPILSFGAGASLTIAATPNLMTIQLGAEDQGAMVKMDANLGSVVLTGMSINDANSGGSIAIGTLTLDSLHAIAAVDVVNGGLQIDTTGTTLAAVGLERLRLGDATQVPIGDVYLTKIGRAHV